MRPGTYQGVLSSKLLLHLSSDLLKTFLSWCFFSPWTFPLSPIPYSESLFFPHCGPCRWDTVPQAPLHMFHCTEEHFSGQGCIGGTLFRCLLNRRDIVSGFSKPHSLALTDSGSQEQSGAVLLTTHSEPSNIIHGTGFQSEFVVLSVNYMSSIWWKI